MMTIDETIKRYEEIAEELEEEAAKYCCDDTEIVNKCYERADEHRQIAEWLRELKTLKEKEKTNPCDYCQEFDCCGCVYL